MTVSIVSNQAARLAQTSLNKYNTDATVSSARLSSGERVFSADQDAAALGMAAGLKTEIAALTTAILNAANGSSMLQLGDGALGQMTDVLVRMSTLASQSSSSQFSNTERVLMQLEYAALRSEIDRISADTEFNGVKLLQGDALYTIEQAHTFEADGINNIQFDSNVVTADTTVRYTYDATEEQMTLHRIEGGTAQNQIIDLTALLDDVAGVGQNLTVNESVELNFGGMGISLTLDSAFDRTVDILPTMVDNSGADITLTLPTLPALPVSHEVLNVTDEAIDALVTLSSGADYNITTGNLTIDVQTNGTTVTFAGITGIRYGIDGAAAGANGAASPDLVSGSAQTIEIYVETASGFEHLSTLLLDQVATTGTTDGTIDVNIGRGLFDADYNTSGGNKTLQFMVGSGVNTNEDMINVVLEPATVTALGLATSNVSTQTAAETAMVATKAAISSIVSIRANLGASQVQLEAAGSNLRVFVENNEQARSALVDVDVSQEITAFTNSQTMTQVAVDMLARANAQPQILLELLR